MEDSSLLLQWAMDTFCHEQPAAAAAVFVDDCSESAFPSLQALREASQAAEMIRELIAEAPASSWSSGDTIADDGTSGSVVNNPTPAAAAMSGSSGGGASNPPLMSWNFSAATATAAQQRDIDDGMVVEVATAGNCKLPDPVYVSPPMRRAGLKSSGSVPAQYAQDHIMAERKRREKINQRFIELSTVIPGLKKMDKATILSDATRYVKELQKKIKDLEADGSNPRTTGSVALAKRACRHAAAAATPANDVVVNGSPLSSSSPGSPGTRRKLPEIDARISQESVMVRIHCEDAKGVVVKVLTEVEELHLGIIHANVMPFPAGTMVMTITTKVEDGFTVTAEEIVARLNTALLSHQDNSCNSTTDEETGN